MKRFWDQVTIGGDDAGHAILLDGRPVHLPGGGKLLVPARALAEVEALYNKANTDLQAAAANLTLTAQQKADADQQVGLEQGEAGQDRQWQRDEDDGDIAEFLKDIVGARILGIVEAQGEMRLRIGGEMGGRHVGAAHAQVAAEMTVEQADDHIRQQREGEDEREEHDQQQHGRNDQLQPFGGRDQLFEGAAIGDPVAGGQFDFAFDPLLLFTPSTWNS